MALLSGTDLTQELTEWRPEAWCVFIRTNLRTEHWHWADLHTPTICHIC